VRLPTPSARPHPAGDRLGERMNVDPDALEQAYSLDRTRPGVRLNFVSSLDGAVEVDGRSRPLSSDVDREVFHLLRRLTDVVMVGAGTMRQEGYRELRLESDVQAWRGEHGLAAQPTLVIVSASLKLDPKQAAFAEAPVRPVVLTHAASPPERRAELEAVADVVICGEATVDLSIGLAWLREHGLDQVLCEGGPHLFGALLAADLVDELCLTLSAQLTGPGAGRIVAGALRGEPLPMRLIHAIPAGEDLLTRYVRA
jgi:riboflavin biosynthesis pyrimidine reductase